MSSNPAEHVKHPGRAGQAPRRSMSSNPAEHVKHPGRAGQASRYIACRSHYTTTQGVAGCVFVRTCHGDPEWMDLSWYIHRIKVKGDSAYYINTAQVLKQVYPIEQRTHIVALAEPHAQETRTALMHAVSFINYLENSDTYTMSRFNLSRIGLNVISLAAFQLNQ